MSALRLAAALALAAMGAASAQELQPAESSEPRTSHCPSDALVDTGLLPRDVELAGSCLLAPPRRDSTDADEIAHTLGRGDATTNGAAAAVASGLLNPPPPPEPEPANDAPSVLQITPDS